MQLHEFAERILFGDTLEEKFLVPEGGVRGLTDLDLRDAIAWNEPGRPAHLQVADKRTRKRLPSPLALDNPDMRIRVLHTFANHELMALELMAWALLAFPEAPKSFRLGLAAIMLDEQRHTQLYINRLNELGADFGDLPLNDHFWRVAESLNTPLKWVCAMNLTFEQANLDHAPVYETHFNRVGDLPSAAIMRTIAEDEELHVGFGAQFLKAHTPKGRASFDVYAENLTFFNSPKRARGEPFQVEARERAGLDEDFIRRMQDL